MANRHLSRSIVMQSLFELDFNNKKPEEMQDILDRNAQEFAPGMGDFSFAEMLADGVLKKKAQLDEVIEKAAPEWPIDKISVVDRNILRLGLYELLFLERSQVPAKVAINEAIELAKTFGGENSGKFVNGVLGAVYKEMGEPGKEETTKKKRGPIDPAKIPVEKLIGAVVYAVDGEDIYLALVHDIFGHWTLSKGHLNVGEAEEDGVKRKVKEELGIDVTVKTKLGENEYIASHPEKGKIRKQVSHYLAEAIFVDLTLKEGGGLDDARWFKLADIIELNIYDDILSIVTKAINILLNK